MSRAGGHAVALLAVVLAGLLTFVSALDGPFILDDDTAIERNASLESLSAALFPPRHTPIAGRPVLNVSLAVDRALFGLDPRAFRRTNLALHLLNAGLLYALAFLLLGTLGERARPLASGGVALLWVVHPLQTEVMNYATQRSELLMASFVLGGWVASVRACRRPPARGLWALAVLCSVLGVATKESGICGPLLAILIVWALAARDQGSPLATLRREPALLAPLAAGIGVLVLLLLSGPRDDTVGFALGVGPLEYLSAQGPILLHYLRLVLLPLALVFDYGPPRPPTAGVALASLGALAVAFAGALVALRLDRRLGCALLAFFVLLAPTSSLIPIATEAGAERRMYLPLAALLGAGVGGIAHAVAWTARSGGTALGLLLAAALALGALSLRRNLDYLDPVRLWQSSVAVWPGNARAHVNLGVELQLRGRSTEAEPHHRRALQLEPGDPLALYNLGLIHQERGELARAERAFLASDAASPEQPHAQLALAGLYEARGERARAARAAWEASSRAAALGQHEQAAALAGLAASLEQGSSRLPAPP